MFNDARILITGGTGSFGRLFVQTILERYSPKEIIVFSRDEMKQWEMKSSYQDLPVRFFIGDVRDRDRLSRACHGVDYLVHAAALKIVPTAELYPEEYIHTNIQGAMNVIQCARDHNVKGVVALSTDKACSPVNLYGATKLCSDKLFVAANFAAVNRDTRFSVVRYGNVMGSRGSVIPFFMKEAPKGVLPITDARMTRFMITLEEGVGLVLFALRDGKGGEIFVKKIPSMKLIDVAQAIAPDAELRFIGIRPGEKLHEDMISAEDAATTVEFKDYYSILPHPQFRDSRFDDLSGGKPCESGFTYSSDCNTEWMGKSELQRWIGDYREYLLGIGTISGEEDSTAQQPLEGVVSLLPRLLQEIAKNGASSETTLLLGDAEFSAAIDALHFSQALQMIQSRGASAPELLLVQAALEVEQEHFPEAIQTISQALKMAPDNEMALSLLAHVSDRYQLILRDPSES